MLRWGGQSCVPLLNIIACSGRGRGRVVGWELGHHWTSALGAQGGGRGWVCKPSDVHHSCDDHLRALLVSWTALKKCWPLLLWGVFFYLIIFRTPHFCPWTTALIDSFAAGSVCRAWARGNPSFQIPYSHEQSFSWCAGFGLSHLWLHICHGSSVKRTPHG